MPATLRVAEHRSTPRETVESKNPSNDLVWQGADYPLIEPGVYLVRGTKVQGPEWLRKYQRWSVRIEFGLVQEPETVSAFFNLGGDRSRFKVGRQSNYWKAWTLANGEPPRRGEKMVPDKFLEGQFFRVMVETAKQGDDGKRKTEAEFYSRIIKFLSAEWA